jgi:acetyltransferase-like isoleucine patch superfamily enzyme
VRGTIPDRCVVAGVPARIVRRWFPERGWVDVSDVTQA